MIAHLYNVDLDESEAPSISCKPSDLEDVKYQVDLYVLGAKYLIPGLCKKARASFRLQLQRLNRGLAKLYRITRHVYLTRADEAVALREDICEAFLQDANCFVDTLEFELLCKGIPELGSGVAMKLAAAYTKGLHEGLWTGF